MVYVLASASFDRFSKVEDWWFEPGLCMHYCVVSLDKKLYSTLSLSSQTLYYKWVPVKHKVNLSPCDALEYPIQGE